MSHPLAVRQPFSRPARRGTLPPELAEDARRRLTWLAALSGILVLSMSILFRRLDLVLGHRWRGSPLWIGAIAASEIASIAVIAVARSRFRSAESVLDLALVYQVLQSLFHSILFHSLPYSIAAPRGWSSVAVWIVVFPLVVPSTRGKAILSTLASLAMDPLGFGLTIAAGNRLPPRAAIVEIFVPTIAAAAVAIVLQGILYRMAEEVTEARAMGNYRLVEKLGSGGMGEVWLAEHRLLARPTAIKLIPPDRSRGSGDDLARRFAREARATANLRSPHTVQVYDFGVTEDGAFYYAMELLDGFDLDTLVARFGPVSPARAVRFLAQACDSLAEAHSLGFVHRDVKPANIYACRYGLKFDFVKILDFGLVKSVSGRPGDTRLTRANVVAGSPHTMAPEIASGSGQVDARSDLYSLGCVAYTLLTGRPVFEDDNVLRLLRRHIEETPPPPSRFSPNRIEPELDAIVLDCLAKDPDARPDSAASLAARLCALGRDEEWTASMAERWWDENGPRSFPILVRPNA